MVETKAAWGEMKHVPAERSDVLNPIRHILEKEMKPPANHPKEMIMLGLGEPSKKNGFELPEVINESIIEVIQAGTANGYTAASGTIEARTAVAKKFSSEEYPIDPNHVTLTFGTSGAMFNAISVLCERGTELLVASPGFPLCQPICENLGVTYKHYNLNPEKQWEADLDHMRSQITEKTKAILVNNPSNPCGSCWSEAHMKEIIDVADEHRIPIIADEVYYGLSYDPERVFKSFGQMTKTVPVICLGALSKIYCIPGWRCGWMLTYNNNGYFDQVLENISKHSMILLHPNACVAAALPRILAEVPESHFTGMKEKLKASSDAAFGRLSTIKGIKPIKASAAMYMMVTIDIEAFKDIATDVDFCKMLLAEENCFTFPSACFFGKNAFRMIICTKPEVILEFGDRLELFCNAHLK